MVMISMERGAAVVETFIRATAADNMPLVVGYSGIVDVAVHLSVETK